MVLTIDKKRIQQAIDGLPEDGDYRRCVIWALCPS